MTYPKSQSSNPKPENGGRPKKYTLEELDKLADEFIEWWKDPFNIWMKDFCLQKKISPKLMTEWCEISKKFSEAYEFGKEMQESKILSGGLFNRFNSKIASLVLAHAHKWKVNGEQEDKQQAPTTNIYHVNYGSPVEVLPKAIPAEDSSSTRQGN